MSIVTQLQGWIALILGIAAFALEVYALIDAVRRRPDAFAAADKRTKGFWPVSYTHLDVYKRQVPKEVMTT